MSSKVSHNYDDPAAPRVCQNCGATLRGPYCSSCGQHDIDYHRSFYHLTHDLLENLFHFEGKFLANVAWLLAKPGRLTADFVAGRRASQVHPLRFYIFVTLLFFVGVHVLNHGHLFAYDRKNADAGVASEPGGPKITVRESSPLGEALNKKFAAGELRPTQIFDALEGKVPTTLFLCMPLCALILKGLYWRTKPARYYIEHLIFAVHLHTWAFLVWMVSAGYLGLAGELAHWLARWLGLALVAWMIWYGLNAFRVVYRQSWPLTIVKATLLAVTYFITVLLLCLALVVGTVAWLVL